MIKQQRGRFFCGIGTAILPVVIFFEIKPMTDQVMASVPIPAAAGTVVLIVLTVVALTFCIIVGLAEWDNQP